jgi:hypothetical protein
MIVYDYGLLFALFITSWCFAKVDHELDTQNFEHFEEEALQQVQPLCLALSVRTCAKLPLLRCCVAVILVLAQLPASSVQKYSWCSAGHFCCC